MSSPQGRDTMSEALHEASNYHDWMYAWVRDDLTGRRILDIGGGTGNHLHRLADRDLVSIDLDRRAVEDLRMRFADMSRWRFEQADITDPGAVDRLGRESYDTVFSSNVFEHIEDDAAAFRNSAALLRPSGRLVLLLPAHAALYGDLDRLAGHHRRYDRRLVRRRFREAGLASEKLQYVNLLGAVGWYLNNRLFTHRELSAPSVNAQIRLFDRIVIPLLRRIENARPLPFGQSLVAVGRKPPAKG